MSDALYRPRDAASGEIEISRRDFLDGVLLASGGAAVGNSIPVRAFAAEATGAVCDGAIHTDPRALRGGNLPRTFNIAHWLRDKRLRFDREVATLTPGCDGLEGAFPIAERSEEFDVIIVGAGLSGLSAAFYLSRQRPRARILLLEASSRAGGNAGRDEAAPLPVAASTAGAYCLAPGNGVLRELYRELHVDWTKHTIADPGDCYYFDEYTPGVRPGHRGWNVDSLGDGMAELPYDKRVVADLLRSRERIMRLTAAARSRSIDDPPDESSVALDRLSTISLEHYLTKALRCDPIVSDFYSLYTIDALGGTAEQVNAHSGLNFLSGELGDKLFTFPGGTSEVARRIVAWLAARKARSMSFSEVELDAVALRVDSNASSSGSHGSVIYAKDQRFHRATARTVIVATQSHIARNLVEHLFDDDRRRAWSEFNTVPVVIANVALRSAAPLHELGLGYSQAWWGSRYWANFGVADWITDRRYDPNRPTVLTFFGGNRAPPDELPQERMKLLHTPFSDYENSLRDDLSRIMRGSKFDFDRDVTAIFLYRWGHSMFMPIPNSVFGKTSGPNGRLDRGKAPRHVACKPLGRIFFAGQHRGGTPSVESALSSGHRAALEALAAM